MESAQVEGIIIIKAQLGDDIRCIPVHNVDITFDELVLMMQRIFKGQLSADDEITIKYKDHDGDLVTITDSNDLTFALQLSHMLRITILANQQAHPLVNDEVKVLRKDLQHVRDLVVKLLDKLELRDIGNQVIATGTSAANSSHHHHHHNGVTAAAQDDTESEGRSTSGAREERPSAHAREFDPLHQSGGHVHGDDGASSVHSVPASSAVQDSGYGGYGAPTGYQQQQQQHQQPSVPQAPQQQQQQPQAQQQAPQSYYPSYGGGQAYPPQQQQQQQHQPQQQQPPAQSQSYYSSGYPQQQQQPQAPQMQGQPSGMGVPPPPSAGAPYGSAVQSYAAATPPPPPMGGGYPGQQPSAVPPPPMGGQPGAAGGPPPPFAGQMMQGAAPRGALPYGRPYQAAYQ